MKGQSNRTGLTESSGIEQADGRESFRLQSVDKARTPRGTEGEDWYKFVIAGVDTKIVSYQRGARDTVLQSIERYLANLNGRSSRTEVRETLH